MNRFANRFTTAIVAAFCCITQLQATSQSTQPNTTMFTINEKEYLFSNAFEFSSNATPCGLVEKKRFAYLHLTNHYDYYDELGNWQARGVSRLFSLGALFSWGTEIDVKDNQNNTIGMIDGQIATLASARFSIYEYDTKGKWHLKGIAFMDDEKRSFSIVDPENNKHLLGSLNRIFLPNLRDHWQCKVFDTNAIDMRIIKVFAAFAVDHQEYFRADN